MNISGEHPDRGKDGQTAPEGRNGIAAYKAHRRSNFAGGAVPAAQGHRERAAQGKTPGMGDDEVGVVKLAAKAEFRQADDQPEKGGQREDPET
jgi:hypothetical protein